MTALVEPTISRYSGRPGYEGANIGPWIGFKHFLYQVEEAVRDHFRKRGLGAGRLYSEHGVTLDLTEISARLPTPVLADDIVEVELRPMEPVDAFAASCRMTASREGTRRMVLTGSLKARLLPLSDPPAKVELPVWCAPFTHRDRGRHLSGAETPSTALTVLREILAPETGDDIGTNRVTTPVENGLVISQRVPYYFCHGSERLQFSGYVRMIEEAVDLFLAQRQISVGSVLKERHWIPVASKVRLTMHASAYMEETLHTVFTLDSIVKDVLHTGRLECFVCRGDVLVHTATATITHGYAVTQGPDMGTLVEFDAATTAALQGGGASR
ncbi:hypothetical protein J4573_02315 [Actinomadura barringtoniae]|uniref:Thioesterase n=1 Tax=Actinomadura barringtoniae TaxID=1427535 RepID=A0A939T243_9ACTN|nr:hypothetical protein [Actinomadura barringtoniae]MBO2445913.1 hypothetical protein [Actinomadura barringtoniae]